MWVPSAIQLVPALIESYPAGCLLSQRLPGTPQRDLRHAATHVTPPIVSETVSYA